MHRVHVVIHGRVQGVGFRAFVIREARALGLAGSVWNRADGTVEIDAEGGEEALVRLVASVQRGPSMARIERVETRASEGPPRHRGFEVA